MSEGRIDVLMVTEGTYPYAVGGVSTCCHQLVTGLAEIDWTVLALLTPTAAQRPLYDMPRNAAVLPPLLVWEEQSRMDLARREAPGSWLPATLLRGLLSWESDLDELEGALVWCRENPRASTRAFASRAAWMNWHEELDGLSRENDPDGGTFPDLDRSQSAELYRTIRWIAHTAAAPTPAVDVVHVTAAGWAGVPAVVHKALHGTPVVLTEHGVYVREAYLAWSRAHAPEAQRVLATRLARGLARSTYRAADVVAPVTRFNASWERSFGVETERIRPIVNGVCVSAGDAPPLPGDRTVVSVGRIDPLKDLKTMLRVAAEVTRLVPDATFVHHGPVSPGESAYDRACRDLHSELGLGDRFVFAGPTSDPTAAVRKADVVVLTSISEGLPMAALEAMGEGRPVVSTAVGGVPELLQGAGLTAPVGAVSALAGAVTYLLRNPHTATELGRLGRERVASSYRADAVLDSYQSLFAGLSGREAAA